MLRFIPLSLFLLFASCSHKSLDVETKYTTYSDLASVRAFTPDSKKQMENIPEQTLLIKWVIPQMEFKDNTFKLEITVRYGNREEEAYLYPLSKRSGKYHFTLDQNTYRQKRSIGTYRVRIMKDKQVYSEFKHPVWTEILGIDED